MSGASGRYRIEGVPAGTYSLTARKAEYVPASLAGVAVLDEVVVTADLPALVRQRGDFVIEKTNEARQGLVQQHLLVERPAQFVEGELVVVRIAATADDGGIGGFRLDELLAGEEVFATSKLEFVYVL